MAAPGAQAHAAHDEHPYGWRRWLFSTNHKDIGTMYLIFALIARGWYRSVSIRRSPAQALINDERSVSS